MSTPLGQTGKRLAIISSPRSGNLWVRSIISRALDLEELPVFNYRDAPAHLPERCILQTHWYREPNFQAWLDLHGFTKLCIARHPLDILISVLHFVRHEPTTARWLEGNVEIPDHLSGATPSSESFLDYAMSFGAENLLSVTYQWWHDSSVQRLRYEDCVADPGRALGEVARRLGGRSQSVRPFIEAFSVANHRTMPNRHVWQGRPALYKQLIPRSTAMKIYRRHQRVFDVLGYRVGAYWISRAAATTRWSELTYDAAPGSGTKLQ
jgi:hypothetical protein